MKTLVCALLILTLAIGTAASEGGVPPSFDDLLAGLGHPPDAEVVARLVAHPALDEGEPAVRLVERLRDGGGHVASRALYLLADQRSSQVRIAALAAIGRMGLRSVEGLDNVRGALRDREVAVRIAAHAAIGRVGESADMQGLLEVLSTGEPALRTAAHHALQALTGLRLGPQPARWKYWWAQVRERLPEQLEAALAHVQARQSPADVEEARTLIVRFAWCAEDRLERLVRTWLRSLDPRLRTEGYRIVAGARLGDLADDVAEALSRERDPGALAAGLEGARALGVATEGLDPLPSPAGGHPR